MSATHTHKADKPAPKTKTEHGSTPPIHGKPTGGMSGGGTTHSGVSGGISAPLPKEHDGKVKISGGIG